MSGCGEVRIVYMGYLAELAGGREKLVRVCGEARVRDIVGLEGVELEDLVILINGRSAKPDSTVRPGDKLTVMPHISGGHAKPL